MAKARMAFVVALVALVSGRAEAADADGAWSSKYGMIFTLQNVFQNNSSAVIGDFGGGVGVQYNLAPLRALRLHVSLSRASNDAYERETTDLVTGTTTKTFVSPTTFTSRYDVNAGASYLMRLTAAPIAPYVGIGAGLGYVQTAMKWENSTPAASVIDRDDMRRDLSLAAAGTLGLEWRVHKSLSLFAEYALGVDLVTWTSERTEQATTSKTTGAVTAGTRVEGSSTKFFNFDTGLGQGGLIGLVAFF